MTMANWQKLNTEFYSVLNNITDVEWDKWMSEKDARKSMRQLELSLRAKIQEEKLLMESIEATQLYFETLSLMNQVPPKTSIIVKCSDPTDNYPYALAA